MTSSKLKMLERQLSQAGAVTPTGENNRISDKMLTAFQTVVEEEAKALVKAAEDRLLKAEAETADVRKQLAELNKQLTQAQKEAHNKMGLMDETSKQEIARMRKDYFTGTQQMQSEVEGLRKELAGEQQARVRAETQKEAAEKMCAHMEQMVVKSQEVEPIAAAPVVMPASEPRPVTAKVTQRDENGRIVAISIMPT